MSVGKVMPPSMAGPGKERGGVPNRERETAGLGRAGEGGCVNQYWVERRQQLVDGKKMRK